MNPYRESPPPFDGHASPPPRRGVRGLLVPIVVPFVASFAVVVACTPAQRASVEAAVEKRAVPALKAACVLVRAFSSEGEPREVCATIDELAPLVGEILAGREMQTTAEQSSALETAIVLPPPKRHHPLRRCQKWVPIVRSDGGTDAGGSGRSAVDGGAEEGGDGGR